MRIDAHHHFWRYSAREYGWIDETMCAIRRDFLPPDLEKEIRGVGIEGVISVQARQTVNETRWLLELAAENSFIQGVVGWVPLTSTEVKDDLNLLASNQQLRAVRHVVQDEPDGFLLRNDFNRGISALREAGLAYDVLIRERQLPEAIRFVDLHPNQIFVLDHLAKPVVKENRLVPWSRDIAELARRENVFCKVSGLVTEADFQHWTQEQLRPYFETVLAAFGADRLMFGTDWPVCLAACSYQRWHDVVQELAAALSAEEKESLFGGTAVRAYGLGSRF